MQLNPSHLILSKIMGRFVNSQIPQTQKPHWVKYLREGPADLLRDVLLRFQGVGNPGIGASGAAYRSCSVQRGAPGRVATPPKHQSCCNTFAWTPCQSRRGTAWPSPHTCPTGTRRRLHMHRCRGFNQERLHSIYRCSSLDNTGSFTRHLQYLLPLK